jgi:hypothetical protein
MHRREVAHLARGLLGLEGEPASPPLEKGASLRRFSTELNNE